MLLLPYPTTTTLPYYPILLLLPYPTTLSYYYYPTLLLLPYPTTLPYYYYPTLLLPYLTTSTLPYYYPTITTLSVYTAFEITSPYTRHLLPFSRYSDCCKRLQCTLGYQGSRCVHVRQMCSPDHYCGYWIRVALPRSVSATMFSIIV